MGAIRILLADDHAVLRSGLKSLLNGSPRFKVVGEAGDGVEALALAESLKPDVVILDISMPGLTGTQCIKEMRHRRLPCRILVLTMHDDEEYVKEAMLAGANGFVPKKSADTELITAIEKVASGQRYISEPLAEALLDCLLRVPAPRPEVGDPYQLLSAREREVLRLLALGHSNSEIALKLSISPKTVNTYRARLMQKLCLTKKSELVTYALQHKLITTQIM